MKFQSLLFFISCHVDKLVISAAFLPTVSNQSERSIFSHVDDIGEMIYFLFLL